MVSLIGIIVRNGIIMFDYTEDLRRKQHKTVREAAIEAGKRRCAYIPDIRRSINGRDTDDHFKSPLWYPMGTVIFTGTIVSMIFVVTVLPLA